MLISDIYIITEPKAFLKNSIESIRGRGGGLERSLSHNLYDNINPLVHFVIVQGHLEILK